MAPVLQEFPPWASVEVCWSQRRQRSQSFHSASGTKRNATADKEKGNGFSMWDKSVVWPHKPKTESNKCRNVTIKCCWGYKIGKLVKFFSRVHRVNQASQQPASDSISTSNQRVRREVTAADTDIIAVWASQRGARVASTTQAVLAGMRRPEGSHTPTRSRRGSVCVSWSKASDSCHAGSWLHPCTRWHNDAAEDLLNKLECGEGESQLLQS